MSKTLIKEFQDYFEDAVVEDTLKHILQPDNIPNNWSMMRSGKNYYVPGDVTSQHVVDNLVSVIGGPGSINNYIAMLLLFEGSKFLRKLLETPPKKFMAELVSLLVIHGSMRSYEADKRLINFRYFNSIQNSLLNEHTDYLRHVYYANSELNNYAASVNTIYLKLRNDYLRINNNSDFGEKK